MNEDDLRVKKTKESVENAFVEMMREKPFEKITVTGLTKRARINKSTFYLHYKDIYDLYEKVLNRFFDQVMGSIDYFSLFLDDPEEFIRRFMQTQNKYFVFFKLLLQNKSETRYQQQIVAKMAEKIYQECSLPVTVENDIKLDTALNMMLYLHPQYAADHPEIVNGLITDVIHLFWNKKQ